jgi:hypothetical protein
MSANVLEELATGNIYYILGFMFLAGISASFYLIMDSINKKFSLSLEKESENFSFSSGSDSKVIQKENTSVNNLDKIKTEISSICDNNEISKKDKLDKVIWKVCNHFQISQALLYLKEEGRGQFTMQTSYAFILSENDPKYVVSGEGLTGQAIVDGTPFYIKDIPEGYMKVISGLGESLPKSLLIIPSSNEKEVISVFELSSLQEYSKNTFDEIVAICNYVSNLITK